MNCRFSAGVKFPILVTFEKIDFAVSAPNKCGINIIGDAIKALGDLLGVTRNGFLVIILPIFGTW